MTNAGSVTSEGSKAHGADRARKFFGVDGTGVKVGVLSDSDDFKEAVDRQRRSAGRHGHGPRPGRPARQRRGHRDDGDRPRRRARRASSSSRPRSTARRASPTTSAALRFTYHCDIIVDDVIYFFESPYQDDIIAQAVSDVIADGALYFSSAGNEGNLDDGTSGDLGRRLQAGEGGAGHAAGRLPGPRLRQRRDLEPHHGGRRPAHTCTGPIRARSTTRCRRTTTTSSCSTPICATSLVAVDRHPGRRPSCRSSSSASTSRPTSGSSSRARPAPPIARCTWCFSAASSASRPRARPTATTRSKRRFAVAAVDVAQAGGGEFTGGPTTPVELFSSDGNRRIFYDPDGNADDAGGTC